MTKLKVIYGNSNPGLAKKVCGLLGWGVDLGIPADKYSDGEIRIQIQGNVRGSDLFIIQSTQPPGDNFLELILMADAARRASASRITAVIPYYGYARQERKDKPRKPISAKAIANCLITSGINRILTVDLHASAIQGFVDIPVDHLYGNQTILKSVIEYFKKEGIDIKNKVVMVAPDAGRANLVRALAKIAEVTKIAIIDKRKESDEKTEVMYVIGAENIAGNTVLLFDDMIDTAGTLTNGAKVLEEKGAKEIYAAATHPVLSGPAIERLDGSPIKKLFVGDTIPLPKEKRIGKIEIISLAELLAKAIYLTHNEESVSQLFVTDFISK